MQAHDTDVMREAAKRFDVQCFEAKGSIEKAMAPFGFEYNPDPKEYAFDASIEVHPERRDSGGESTTYLVIYGVQVDMKLRLLYSMKVRTK